MVDKADGLKKLKAMRSESAWIHVYDLAQSHITHSMESFIKTYEKEVLNFTELTHSDIYSKVRIDELLRSCADDLFRYAVYHKVKNAEEHYEIAEAILASYIVKWVMHFRPLVLDNYKNYLARGMNIDEDTADFFRLGNEKYAMFVASQCLNIVKKDSDGNEISLLFVFDLMEKEERKDFIYTLRYRDCHQDLYRALFRRISVDANR